MKIIALIVTFLFTLENSFAEDDEYYWPIGMGIAPYVQIPGNKTTIKGLRFGIPWASNNKVRGLSFSALGNQSRDFAGSEIGGIFNKTRTSKIEAFSLHEFFISVFFLGRNKYLTRHF